ncbi:MAG: Holliday junction resolvase RuvX [Saprospiraceae bacterium]|nr:Holliday junction resolvase RuvX [Bacteroidia bacterium]NNE15128.1 Holliday junction resolvase RuvX [Saprospiraceae bacterium]NNL91756.1 Holliday junction resolvase RuvX [Saprospiraceae bacterium]
MARILGIDYGIKRVGISATDELQIIVSPLKTVNTNTLLDFFKIYLQEQEVEKIVFGYPTHKDGSPTYVVNEIEAFVKKFKILYPKIEIDFQNENYTSVQALDIMIKSGLSKKQRKDKSRLDKISAVLILQRYLKHI